MAFREDLQQRLAELSGSMEQAPARDRVIYHLVHGGLILVSAGFVLAGCPWVVWAAIVLALSLTAKEFWQVELSRRFSLACLALMGLFLIGSVVVMFWLRKAWVLSDIYSLITFLAGGAGLILWFWSADRLYKVQFQLPPEDTGPW